MGSAAGDTPSGRELEVLKTAARGPTNAEIAEELHLAEATVKRHLANVHEKLRGSPRATEPLPPPWPKGGSAGRTCCPTARASPRRTARCSRGRSTAARRPAAGARSWRSAPRPPRGRAPG